MAQSFDPTQGSTLALCPKPGRSAPSLLDRDPVFVSSALGTRGDVRDGSEGRESLS